MSTASSQPALPARAVDSAHLASRLPPIRFFASAAPDVWRLRDGTVMTLRPMHMLDPYDLWLLDGLLQRLSPAARHNRFHGGVNSWPALLTPLSARQTVCFVVTAERLGHLQMVAEARYAINSESDGHSAEFALVVDDRWQRRGMGERCMRALANTAVHAGLHWLYGEIRTSNRPMLALMQRCRFCCTPDQSDPDLVHAEMALRAPQPALAPPQRHPRWLHWQRGAGLAADAHHV